MVFFNGQSDERADVEIVTPNSEFEPRVAEVFTPRTVKECRYSHAKIFTSEAVGTFVFVWLGLMNVTQFVIYPANLTWTGVALGWAMGLFVGIQVASKYSNAYLNPCMALSDMVLGNLPLFEFFIYFAAEMVGAFLAAVVTYGLNYKSFPEEFPCGVFATSASVTKLQAFFIELFATAIFSFVIFRVPSSSMKPAIISAALGMLALSMGFQTAFSYNFARDFSPRIFAGIVDDKCFQIGYGFLVALANFGGAVIGAVLAQVDK